MESRKYNIDYILEDTKRSVKTHVDLGDAAGTIHYQNQLIGLLDKDRDWLEGQNSTLIAEHKLMKEALGMIANGKHDYPIVVAKETLKQLSDGK